MTYTLSCISCNRQIRDGIYNSSFYPNLLIIFSAFIVLAVLVALLAYINGKTNAKQPNQPDKKPMGTAAMVLGIGLGGFADGIVLHQIMQWHEMLSAKVPATNYVGKSINMFWDGVFHLFCFIVVIIGVYLMWRAAKNPSASKAGRLLSGGMLVGWAVFNLVEGTINHHWLKLHNVMEYAVDHGEANYLFLFVSLIMLIAGILIMRSSGRSKT